MYICSRIQKYSIILQKLSLSFSLRLPKYNVTLMLNPQKTHTFGGFDAPCGNLKESEKHNSLWHVCAIINRTVVIYVKSFLVYYGIFIFVQIKITLINFVLASFLIYLWTTDYSDHLLQMNERNKLFHISNSSSTCFDLTICQW